MVKIAILVRIIGVIAIALAAILMMHSTLPGEAAATGPTALRLFGACVKPCSFVAF